MSNSNNKISYLISSQVPGFVKDDHEKFVRFIEAYYEFLEQPDQTVDILKNLVSYQDVDQTIDLFSDKLYENFMKSIPTDVLVDKNMLLKHIKDFYRAKGTEKSTRFLMRILFDKEIDFYYPKKDILRVSDGKWFIQKSLRISNTTLNGVADYNLSTLEKYINTQIVGQTSGAHAVVERVDRFYNQGVLIDELILSNVAGDFINGETISALFDDVESTSTLTSDVYGGIINSISVINPGSEYMIGDPVLIISNTGTAACATVAQVSTGNIAAISVYNGGAGFRANDFILFTGGGSGSGANANVSSVLLDESIHPNTYNICYSTISLEKDTQLGNTRYSNLSIGWCDKSNALVNGMNFFAYSNTGPAKTVLVINPGTNYSEPPTISVIANTMVQSLGILGRMEIKNPGLGYTVGDIIEFINVPGGYGAGANGIVNSVNVIAGSPITSVKFTQMTGHIIGGSGYDMNHLPIANVRSATGTGANVVVTSILGSGATLVANNSTIGAIERIVISNPGKQYLSIPTIDLSHSGDGKATANASIVAGVYSYPGIYLNDDGQLSSYNFIQDRDYYQNFSYVIKIKESIDKYRQALKELIHPAGTKMFGEYVSVDETLNFSAQTKKANGEPKLKYTLRTYVKVTGNTVNVAYPSNGLTDGTKIRLEYKDSGANPQDIQNVNTGIYLTKNTKTNSFEVFQSRSIVGTHSGNVYVGLTIT